MSHPMPDVPTTRAWAPNSRRILRRLPRRSTLKRNPLLKRVAGSFLDRDYLWSWRDKQVLRALYMGWFLALQPLGGLQLLGAVFGSLALKANLTVAAGLQFVTNPITAGPIYIATYQLGKYVLAGAPLTHTSWFTSAALYLFVGGAIAGLLCAVLSHMAFAVVNRRRKLDLTPLRADQP